MQPCSTQRGRQLLNHGKCGEATSKFTRFNVLPLHNLTQVFYNIQVQEFLLDGTPCAGGDVIPPIPYVSLAADVCKINSKVFPNLGSITHSKVSGWLYGIQKKKSWEGASFSRYGGILRDKAWGEFGITYCSIARDSKASCNWCYCEPYVHISKRPAGTYTCTHISGLGLYSWLQIWRKHSPASKAEYQLLWIKRLAVDETLWTKRFRLIIYFRVPSQSPEGIFRKGVGQIWIGGKRKVTDHKFAMTIAPLGIWYPRYWSVSVDAWGIPVEKKYQYFKDCETEKLRSVPTVTGGFHLHCILRKEGSCKY